MSRRARMIAAAVAVGVAANVAAVTLIDEPSDGRRRAAAENDLRARLARQGVSHARVSCESGRRCTVTRGAQSVTVDPRLATPLSGP
jgi:hypothetical protein